MKSEKKKREEQSRVEQPKITRARLPRDKQVIGTIDQRFGGNKMGISCNDGKVRNCRVPGRLKRKLWLRPGNIVLIEPWDLDDSKGDVIFKYPGNQISWLKKNGYLKEEESEF